MKISLFKGILLAVFVIGALAGIFVFATHTNAPKKEAIGPVVIWGTLPKTPIQTMLTALAQNDETFKSISYVQKDPAALTSDLSTAIATGNAPDLVLASQETLHSISKFIAPIPLTSLSERTFASAFVAEGSLFTAPNGAGYYGIPFLIDPLALYSNRTILATDGVAKPPATWEALTGLVSKVAVLTPSRQITRGLIALGTYDNVHNARGILSALFLQTGVPISGYTTGGSLVADLGTASGDSSPGQAVVGFYTQFTDPSKISYTWNASLPDSAQSFLAGDLALYLGYASEARFLRAANPNLDFDISPLPQPATATAKSTYGLLYSFMIPRGAINAAGAYQAAVLLTNPPEQMSASALTGLAPATLTQLSTTPSDPVDAVSYAEALYARGWLSPAPASTDAIFSGMIGNVISGRSTLDSALSSAEQTLSALLQQ
jgi:maltose-binding protein MalE